MTQRRFVILEHDHPFLHWDFLLQQSKACRTYRLLKPVQRQKWLPAELLPDHRLMYLDYEGPVSGNRGTVNRIVQGNYLPKADRPATSKIVDCPDAVYDWLSLNNTNLAEFACCRHSQTDRLDWWFE